MALAEIHIQEQAIDFSKKKDVSRIFLEAITLGKKCLKTMRHIQSWDDLLGLADFINGKLPSPPDTLANDWNTRFLTNVNKKYSNYIPLSIGERVVH